MKTGIDGIGIYVPRRFVDLKELIETREEFSQELLDKLHQESFAIPATNEDSVSLAANSLNDLLENSEVNPEEIGRLVVATETPVDFSKPMGGYLHSSFNLPEDCEIYEIKNACIGGTLAMMDAMNWAEKTGKKAVIICTDIAKYQRKTRAEPTQGAGAVSLLISRNPRILSIDDTMGGATKNVHDFFRPLRNETAIVNSAESLKYYQRGLINSLNDFVGKGGEPNDLELTLFHIPYPGIVERLSRKLPAKTKEMLPEEFSEKAEPALIYSQKAGNLYTGSLYLSLASLLNNQPDIVGKRIGLYSYGSGYSAKFFTGTVEGSLRQLNLGPSERVSIRDYDLMRNGEEIVEETEGFVLSNIDETKRREYKNLTEELVPA